MDDELHFDSGFPEGRVLGRYVDLGLNTPFAAALNSLIAYEKRPWEREARTLAGRK